MADTALTLITDSLLDIGVLADEETPSASQVQGGLRKLNNMIDAWAIENLLVYGTSFNIFPFVPNKTSYTIGIGGDINIQRPVSIQSAFIRDVTLPTASQVDLPLQMYNDQQWQSFPLKLQTGTYPYGVWFDYAEPYIIARFTPIPTSSQYSLIIWTTGTLGSLTQDSAVVFEPGYKRALTANLCIEIAPSYGVEVSPAIAKIALESKAWLKIRNTQTSEMSLPEGLSGGGYFDYKLGLFR